MQLLYWKASLTKTQGRCLGHVFHLVCHYFFAADIIGARRDDLEGLIKAHIGGKDDGMG